MGVSILGEQPVPHIGANTKTVNQDARENFTIKLLGASILRKQPILSVRVNNKGKVF